MLLSAFFAKIMCADKICCFGCTCAPQQQQLHNGEQKSIQFEPGFGMVGLEI
jgi:hypothetical protein